MASLRKLLTLLVAACLLCVASAVRSCNNKYIKQAISDNNRRRSAGNVRCDWGLSRKAEAHSRYMCRRGYLSHDNFSGRCKGLRACGENVLYNYTTTSSRGKVAMQQWYDSPPHRRNMLSGSYNRIGLAYISCRGRQYWTAFYAKK